MIDYKFLIYGHKFPQYLANNTKQILTVFSDDKMILVQAQFKPTLPTWAPWHLEHVLTARPQIQHRNRELVSD